MELQTKFLHIKTHSAEDLLVLGIFPTNPRDVESSVFEDFVFAMFPAKVTIKAKTFTLSDWAPLSKAKLFKIPLFAIMNADSPTDQAAEDYSLFLIEKKVDAEAIKEVIEGEFGGMSSSTKSSRIQETPRTLH